MADYIRVEFEFLSAEQREILIALLSGIDYEGFEEQGDLLKAYIPSEAFDQQTLHSIATTFDSPFSIFKVSDTNWNQFWESNFQTVVVNHSIHHLPWVGIRADFHEALKQVEYEIVITPKMSFGTGHHPTTFMMLSMMSEINFADKTVLDFGTGTGILAMLSEKLGASRVVAIDNDDQSIENANENFRSNGCSKIDLRKASDARGSSKFHIILANIVRSVILDNLSIFTKRLIPNGVILLSGLLQEDEELILESSIKNNLKMNEKIERQGWICLLLTQ